MRNFYSNIVGLPEGDGGETWCIDGNEIFWLSLIPADMQGREKGWAKCPNNLPCWGIPGTDHVTIRIPGLKGAEAWGSDADIPLHAE